MPVIDSELIDSLKISSDATTNNLQELKADAQGNIRLQRGRSSIVRTTGANATEARARIKAQSFITIPFRSNTDTTRSMGVAFFGADTPRAFEVKIGQLKVSGVALIDDDEQTYDTTNAQAGFTVTLRPSVDHEAWTWEVDSS